MKCFKIAKLKIEIIFWTWSEKLNLYLYAVDNLEFNVYKVKYFLTFRDFKEEMVSSKGK